MINTKIALLSSCRFWKKVFVRIAYQGDNPVVQLSNSATDKEPFQELPLQACYSVSEVGAQQFDQFGKIFTVKLQYVFYKERPGVRFVPFFDVKLLFSLIEY